MLIDKLPWCAHQGDAILSLHVHPSGVRFASAGSDGRIKVWSTLPALDSRQEHNAATPKLLATMTDHNGPVNVVRFSHNGRCLASGSDDHLACIYELRAGAGGGVLGGESNIENWRARLVLRGHMSNIVDLDWAPDDARLATASLDRSVHIWDAAAGTLVTTLTAHSSFVKGVAWDPVGTYLATLSEDHTLVVWKTDDWSLVATIADPFKQMVSATYACRLSWSPDGRFLLAGNSYQGATHAAVAVPREAWNDPGEYLYVSGHGGAVVSTAFGPKLFRVPPLGGGPPAEALSPVFALGAQDKRVTVWATAAQRPIFCGSRLFKGQVLDLAWMPDGRALLASSSDGTVACLQFDSTELGEPASAEEMAEAMRSLYGSTTMGSSAKRSLAESAEQLDMEKRAAGGGAKAAVAPGLPLVKKRKQPLPMAAGPTAAGPSASGAGGALAALDARLGGVSGAAGVVTQTGFDSALTAGGATKSGTAAARELMPPPPPRPAAAAAGAGASQGDLKKQRLEGPAAAAATTAVSTAPALLLSAPRPVPVLRTSLGSEMPLLGSATAGAAPLELRVTNKERGHSNGSPHAEVSLMRGSEAVWQDVVPATIIAAAGTPDFSAVATSDGHVIVYTAAGRRAAPALRMGAGIAALRAATAAPDRLLVVTTTGRLRLLNAVALTEELSAELAPLLEGGGAVLDVDMSASEGLPLITLTNASAYVWHRGLQVWARIADDVLAFSRFSPVPSVPGQGELAEVQAAAAAGAADQRRRLLVGGNGSAAALAQQQVDRGVAESNLAAAEALGSAMEYRAWLATYARILVDSSDEARLRELSDWLMGPAGGMSGGAGEGAEGQWSPTVVTHRKRDLLREVVLREVGRKRELGALWQRCRLALDDAEAADAMAQHAQENGGRIT